MKRSKFDLAVGLFVAFGLMSLVFLALKVGNLAGYDSGEGYRIEARFDKLGLLPMRHGVARLFIESHRVLLRPRYPTLWAFLWIWPMKATIDLQADGEAVVLAMTKRTPWASAILTGAWFLIVTVGTLATIVSYAVEGGLGSSGGVVMAGGILTLGLFFIFSGLVTVVMAYRMENSRLAALQQEFQDTLTGRVPATR